MIKTLFAVVVLIVGLFGLWKLAYPTPSYRYRLTIEVEKNGVIHTGSSVVELNTTRNRLLAGLDNIPEWETHPRGEAVFVDLGDGDNLIALLEYDSAGSIRQTSMLPSRIILGDDNIGRGLGCCRFDELAVTYPDRLAAAKGKSFPVRIDQLPPLIRFRHLDDPLSVERVDPADLAANYGPSVAFRGARLEITDEPVTKGIAQRLIWLDRFKGKALDGGHGVWRAGVAPYSTPEQIGYRNFSME